MLPPTKPGVLSKEELVHCLKTMIEHVNELFEKIPKMTDAEYAAYQAYMREIDAIIEGFRPLMKKRAPNMKPYYPGDL